MLSAPLLPLTPPQVVRAIESFDITSVRASVGNYLVSKYVREKTDVKVVFNGEGADSIPEKPEAVVLLLLLLVVRKLTAIRLRVTRIWHSIGVSIGVQATAVTRRRGHTSTSTLRHQSEWKSSRSRVPG